MFGELDVVARVIAKRFPAFVGGRPGLTINLWASWEGGERGWFLSRHDAVKCVEEERLFTFLQKMASQSGSLIFSPKWRVMTYSGRCDKIPYTVKFRFIFDQNHVEEKEVDFLPCSEPATIEFVNWFGEKVGFTRIKCGPAPKPPREGVADLFHLWENRMVRGWKITDVDLLIFEDEAWRSPKAVIEIKRSSEQGWKPRPNDPHDLLCAFAQTLGVPFILIHHTFDPRRYPDLVEGSNPELPAQLEEQVYQAWVDYIWWDHSSPYDFERFSSKQSRKRLKDILNAI